MIEIRGIRKSFAGVEVLRGIDLSIGAGEIVALIGRSGCGKTTLLRCINFLEDYDAGRDQARRGGPLVPAACRPARDGAIRKRSWPASASAWASSFQQYNLFPHMTALENVSPSVPASGRS